MLALNAAVEGQTTPHDRVDRVAGSRVKVSRLAQGRRSTPPIEKEPGPLARRGPPGGAGLRLLVTSGHAGGR
jgi:hypothetical protein